MKAIWKKFLEFMEKFWKCLSNAPEHWISHWEGRNEYATSAALESAINGMNGGQIDGNSIECSSFKVFHAIRQG